MSVREEDRQKNCPSRGLGIAAAAIGVGVGAALYYFFNKRAETPNGEGSTMEWSCEEPQALESVSDSENSYLTVSEHSTSDTSIHNTTMDETTMDDTSMHVTSSECNSDINTSCETPDSSDESDDASSDTSQSDMSYEPDSSDQSDTEISVEEDLIRPVINTVPPIRSSNRTIYNGINNSHRQHSDEMDRLAVVEDSPHRLFDSESEWDVTDTSIDIPNEYWRTPTMRNYLNRLTRHRVSSPRVQCEDQQMAILREQAFRERSWAVEECSICFDTMLQSQEVMALACTHRFHQQCILPWLQERQTCPNCRKVA